MGDVERRGDKGEEFGWQSLQDVWLMRCGVKARVAQRVT